MELYYEIIEGIDPEATPIYLLHTIPLDGNYLRTSLTVIDHKNTIVSLDFRDHGRSDDSKRKNQLKFRTFANDVNNLRKSLGHKNVILFAHGIGGFVALKFLMWHRKNVEKLVLFETAVDSKYRQKLAWNIRERFSNQIKDLLEPFKMNASATALEVKFYQSFAMHFSTPNYTKAKYLMESSYKMGLLAYALMHKEFDEYNMKGIGSKYHGSCLLIRANESLWPEEEHLRLKREFPQSQELTLDKGGHYCMVEDPSYFWMSILEKIEE